MQTSPVFFIHGGRVVRGSIKRRLNQHRAEVQAETYLYADGTEQGVLLNFFRRLGHEEITADAGVLLALVQETEPKDEAS